MEVHVFFVACDGVGEDVSIDGTCIITISSTAGLGSGSSLSKSGTLETLATAEVEGWDWCGRDCDSDIKNLTVLRTFCVLICCLKKLRVTHCCLLVISALIRHGLARLYFL